MASCSISQTVLPGMLLKIPCDLKHIKFGKRWLHSVKWTFNGEMFFWKYWHARILGKDTLSTTYETIFAVYALSLSHF